ncbi:MAG TPA: EAL domain-containing protein [Rhodanobacteraceae bacterium]|nr:EAL domain-containing protein [Rhodanobacteraceae bacterium]
MRRESVDGHPQRPAARLAGALASTARILEVIWPFLVAIVLLCALSYFRSSAMTAVRAYIDGESLWSKGQKDSYFFLDRFAHTRAEADYQAYLDAIAIPLGDHAARVALEQARPDLEAARKGFLVGGNDPADVPGMIWLFRNFREVDGFAKAIAIWSEADVFIERFTRDGEALREAARSGGDSERMPEIQADIAAINARLAPMEIEFSRTLGAASRRFEAALDLGLFALAFVMVLIGALLSRRVLQQRAVAVAALRTSEERYALAVEGANDGIWDYDCIGRTVFYSPRVRDMLGYGEDALGADPADLERVILPEDYPAARAAMARHWEQRSTGVLRHRLRVRTNDGRVLWILARSKTMYSPGGAPLRMAGSCTDITEQVENELKLRLAATVFESNHHQGILIVNAEGNIVSANRAFAQLSGYEVEELIGRAVGSLRSPEVEPAMYAQIWQIVKTVGHWRGESVGRTRGGEDHPIDLSIVRVPDPDNQTVYYIYSGSDISERRYAAARIQHLAYIDVLTGLPNRSFANAHFETLIVSARAVLQTLAVVFVDLDGFKEVNDELGHAAGDKVIIEQAQRLRGGLDDGDVLCRFGGDEFLLLLPGRDGAQAMEIARRLIARLGQSILLDQRELRISASAGISVFPFDAGDAETLIRAADTALYRAKAQGKNMAVQFRMDMDRAVARRFDLLSALRTATEHEEFELRFQPIVDAASGAVIGAETLVYWNHPQQGLIGPSTFIALAEESGQIETLGAWLVDEAVKHYADWMQRGISPIYLSMNVSTLQLRAPFLFQQRLDDALSRGLITPDRVLLEISERQIVHDLAGKLPLLKNWADRGIGLAIDDFGVGHSSLAYLKNLPLTQIKIDLAFIRNLTTDRADRDIVKAIVDLGRSLNLGVVAKGVESDDQLAVLRECGCPALQGFLFAKPLQSAAFTEYVLARQRADRNIAASAPNLRLVR